MDLTTILGAIAAAVAAGAAVGSWRAAAQANKAAEQANATADVLAQIEHDRWHTELAPTLQVELTKAAINRAELKVTLHGPPGLDKLDKLSVSVRDDGYGHPVTTGTSKQEAQEASQTIWGPYRFVRGVDGASEDSRHATFEGAITQGSWRLFSMEETPAPSWSGPQKDWQDRYKDRKVQLTFTCTREGHRPWTIPREVTIQEFQ